MNLKQFFDFFSTKKPITSNTKKVTVRTPLEGLYRIDTLGTYSSLYRGCIVEVEITGEVSDFYRIKPIRVLVQSGCYDPLREAAFPKAVPKNRIEITKWLEPTYSVEEQPTETKMFRKIKVSK